MAIVRRSQSELRPGRVDRAKLDATTEADIRRHMIEDGFDPDRPFAGLREVAAIRKHAGLSQEDVAKALRVPVSTLRNWKQGRTPPDPAAQSLLAPVADDPARPFKALGQ